MDVKAEVNIDEKLLINNMTEFQNLNERNEVLYNFMMSDIMSREDYDNIHDLHDENSNKGGYVIASVLLRIFLQKKTHLQQIISILEKYENHKIANIIKTSLKNTSKLDGAVKISSKESYESITLAISKRCNLNSITSLTLDHIDIVKNAAFAKVHTPNLQHLTVHYNCAELGSLHDKSEIIYADTLLEQMNPFIYDGNIQKLLPVDRPILELSSVFITINSLILIKTSESSLVMCGLENSLAQKCLDKFGRGTHTLAIRGCGGKITLPKGIDELKVFACQNCVTNIGELKVCSLNKFSYGYFCSPVIRLSKSMLSVEHLRVATNKSLSSLCFANAKYVYIVTRKMEHLSNMEKIFPAVRSLFVNEWVEGDGVTNVFKKITTLANQGCKSIIWRKYLKDIKNDVSLWSQEDRKSFKEVGINRPEEYVKMLAPKSRVGSPEWTTFDCGSTPWRNAWVSSELLELFFNI